jgi:hypothetical protein
MEISFDKEQIQNKLFELHKKNEHYLPALFFLSGFLFDLITIGDIDDLMNIMLQGLYLIVAGHILFLEISQTKELKQKYLKYYMEYKGDIFHFLLGSLLSAFTIFYFKSASLSNSFIFMLFLASLLLLNEFPFFKSLGPVIKSALYMLCLLSYLIYVIPIIFGKTGIIYFLLATIIALIFIFLKLFFLRRYNDEISDLNRLVLIPQVSILVIYLFLYLTKLIPPVPLSLKHIGIYHNVKKTENDYITTHNKPWYNFWSNGDQNFLARTNDKVFVFTKVFAPAGFDGKIFIHWLKQTEDGLKTSDRIPLKVTGGRREGFRGYAYKQNYTNGDWQIRIETKGGLEIGRINLTIQADKENFPREFTVKNQI